MSSAIVGLVVANFAWVAGGVGWETTLHMTTVSGDPNDPTGMQDLADALDVPVSGFPGAWNNANQYLGVTVHDLSSTLIPEKTASSAVTGTRGTALTPQESCIVATLDTGKIGRAFRGRMYFSGGVAGDLDNGGTDWAQAYADDIDTLVSAIFTAALGAPTEYVPVIYHRAAGQGGVPAADTATVVTGERARTELAVQKRRRN